MKRQEQDPIKVFNIKNVSKEVGYSFTKVKSDWVNGIIPKHQYENGKFPLWDTTGLELIKTFYSSRKEKNCV